ncbi:MAG TPA: myo-inosose-2 dehydratase [Steroidobacteraceae bacterium]|jgi:inosose dehydratase|nr:myo-inosose-2 dehydratase [Steroidobacteraceae bacterium]
MTVRLGINPLTWSNDDLPALGAENSLEMCLTEARAAGYTGVELGNKFPRQAAKLRPILQAHGLALVSGWYSGRLLERDAEAEWTAMRAHFELLQALDCKVVVFAEVSRCTHGDQLAPISQRPCLPKGEWPRFAQRLNALAERMQREGLRMAYHHHMGTVVQSAEDIDQLMTNTGDAVGLLLDTGHLTYAGGDPVQAATRYAKRIVHVHCKDVRRNVLERCRNRDSSFLNAVLEGVFTVPGDGMVDYRSVLQPIARSGYRGWLVVEAEQDPAVAPPLQYAQLGFRNLSALAREQKDWTGLTG